MARVGESTLVSLHFPPGADIDVTPHPVGKGKRKRARFPEQYGLCGDYGGVRATGQRPRREPEGLMRSRVGGLALSALKE